MTFKHNINFLDSPVMRELERHAISKGIIKLAPITKEASVKSLDPTDDLLIDLFKLADGLKEKGFNKAAESLEDKVLAFKMAETHLYRVIDEDGEDLIGFAHPKKVNVADAKDDNGTVENLLEQHKKIVDIVNKNPTGKIASVLSEVEDLFEIKKKAQISNQPENLVTNKGIVDNYTDIDTIQNDFFKFINQLSPSKYFTNSGQIFAFGNKGVLSDKAITLVKAGLGTPEIVAEGIGNLALKFYLDANHITSLQWSKFLAADPDWQFPRIFSKENLNNANDQLKQTLENLFYAKLRNVNIGQVPNMDNVQNVQNSRIQIINFISAIKSVFDEYSEFTFKVLTNMDGKTENRLRQYYIPQLLTSARSIKSILENKLSSKNTNQQDSTNLTYKVNNISDKFKRLSETATTKNHPAGKEFAQISEIIKTYAPEGFNKVRDNLAKIDQRFKTISSMADVDDIAIKWENYFKDNKVAFSKTNIKKTAGVFDGPPKTQETPGTQTIPVANKPPAAQTGRAAKQNHAVSLEKTRPNEYRSVVLMQESLQALAQNLDGKMKEAAGLSDQQINYFKVALTGTGWARETINRHENPVDGRWGTNTSTALKIAQNILNTLKSKKLIEGDTTITTERQYNSGKSEEEIAKLAQTNVGKINIALQVAKVPVPNKATTTSFYDKLPQVKIPEDTNAITTPESEGKFQIGPEDLNSFTNLHNYLTNHGLTESDSAKDVIGSGFNAGKWKAILLWFSNRANNQKQLAPDSELKDKYIQDVAKLWNKFINKMNALEQKQGSPVKVDQLITPYELDGNAPEAANTGRTQDKTTPGNNEAAEGTNAQFVVERSKDILKQPFGYYIDSLWELKKIYPEAMGNWNVYDKLLKSKMQLNVEDYEADPKFFMSQYIKPLTWDDILNLNPQINKSQKVVMPNNTGGQQVTNYTYQQLGNMFPSSPLAINLAHQARMKALTIVIRALYTDLQNVIEEWQKRAYDQQIPPMAIRAGNSAWKRWSAALYSLIESASRELRASNIPAHSETTFM